MLGILLHGTLVSPYLFICPYGLMGVYFILRVIIQCSSVLLPRFQLWPRGTLSLLPYPCDIPLVCVRVVRLHFSPFWHCKMVWVHLSSSCPSPSHFSKGSWFLLLQTGIRNQDLGTRYNCYWGFLTAQPSQQTEQGSIVSCVCARICVCVTICIKLNTSCPLLTRTFPLPLQQGEPGSCHLLSIHVTA